MTPHLTPLETTRCFPWNSTLAYPLAANQIALWPSLYLTLAHAFSLQHTITLFLVFRFEKGVS